MHLTRTTLLLAALSVLVTTATATLCVTYGKTDCQQHPECAVCRAFDRLDVCLDVDLARKMTKGPFECDVPEEPQADHNAACDDLQKPACESTPGCVWCISAAVPSSCFTEADAHRLPAAVFQCHFPSSLA